MSEGFVGIRFLFTAALALAAPAAAIGQAGATDDWEARDLALTPAIAPTARIHCASGQCPAGARRNADGSTTVAVALPGGRTRAILFSAGGNNVIGANEHGDVGGEWTGHGWTVTLGAERYEIPEALVTRAR